MTFPSHGPFFWAVVLLVWGVAQLALALWWEGDASPLIGGLAAGPLVGSVTCLIAGFVT